MEDNKQVASHEQQIEAILRVTDIPEYFPGTTVPARWRDSGTGSSFESRTGLMGFLRHVAERYPQPPHAPGRLFIYDESRFSRALKDGQVDLHASQEMLIRFARLGWQVVFINRPPTGNPVMDAIMDTIAFAQSSDYLVKLKASVTRGKSSWGRKGYWLGGPPPFPARRVEAVTRRPLADGVKSTEQTVLAPDPAKVEHWNTGARMLLAGRTVMDVVRYFSAHVPNTYKVRSGRAARWSYSAVQKMFTNPALIGQLHYRLGGEVCVIDARWDPVVDVDLFRRVNAELARRTRPDARPAGRRKGSPFPIRTVRCAACATPFRGTTSGGRRYYVHAAPDTLAEPGERAARARAAGCRTFTVNAAELEARLSEVILRHRCSPEAAEDIVASDAARRRSDTDDAARLEVLRREEQGARAQYDNLREALRDATDPGFRKDLLAGEVRRALERVRFELHAAEARENAAAEGDEAVRRTIAETARIVGGWSEESTDEQQAVLDQWVEDVLIDVEHEPGKRWPTAKRAFISLSEAPHGLHRRRRLTDETPEWVGKLRAVSHLGGQPFMCLRSEAYPRPRSTAGRGCPRG